MWRAYNIWFKVYKKLKKCFNNKKKKHLLSLNLIKASKIEIGIGNQKNFNGLLTEWTIIQDIMVLIVWMD